MTAPRNWVIGRGLLGSSIADSLDHEPLHVPVRWNEGDAAIDDLRRGLQLLTASPAPHLSIYWSAGRSVTSSPIAQLEAELNTFEEFLRGVADLPPEQRDRISIFLASSVGGAFAGSAAPPFSESTIAVPLSGYGSVKLRMEDALREATARGGWRSFVARITNIYGPGQNLSKGQGLLSVIASSYISRNPASIYVSLDTLRDYIYADDCARVVIAGTDRVARCDPGTSVLKIVGAMTAQSIGAILGENRRLLGGRRPPIVLGQGDAVGQALDLRVRSEIWTDLDDLVSTTLPEGLHRLFSARLGAAARGDR